MEENSFNNQGVTEKREPLPTFNEQPEKVTQYDTLPDMVFQEQPPVFVQDIEAPNQDAINKIQSNASSALGKAIASVIMSVFPILSLFAVFLGEDGVNYAEEAIRLARKSNIRVGGKAVVAKILGMIGKYEGILMSFVWFIYIVILIYCM